MEFTKGIGIFYFYIYRLAEASAKMYGLNLKLFLKPAKK